MEPILVNTLAALQEFLNYLPPCNDKRPNLYIDLEGDDLCRHGTLSLVTIFVESRRNVHLIDVATLKAQAFSTAGNDGRTLKSLLESKDIIKVFFDIRNDSDALFSHYGIRVQGIEDVQLMELATRSHSKRLFNGLAKCIENNSDIGYQEKREWNVVKSRGQILFKTGRDGYAIFDRRPLPADVQEYCVQDVAFLPKLRDSHRAKLCDAAWLKIQEETLARIALSQSSSYNGKGRHMALGPTGWQNWHPTPVARRERSLVQDDRVKAEVDLFAPVASSVADPSATSSEAEDEKKTAPEESAIFRALQEAMDREDTPELDDSDELEHFDAGFSGGYRSGWGSRSSSPKDLTACDAECGYCGHCMY